jgi:hypothetical protein
MLSMVLVEVSGKVQESCRLSCGRVLGRARALTGLQDDDIVVARSDWRWLMAATAFVTVVRDRLAPDDAPLAAGGADQRLLGDIERRGGDLGNLQYEISEVRRELREQLQLLRADMRRDLAESNADALRWAILFWIGQAVAVAGIVSALR